MQTIASFVSHPTLWGSVEAHAHFSCRQCGRSRNGKNQKFSVPSSLHRRFFLQKSLLFGIFVFTAKPADALRPGKPSKEQLLERMNRRKTPEEIAEEKERFREERQKRLERQRELQAGKGKTEGDDDAELEGNLRAQYYFPTSRLRYLSRIRRACQELSKIRQAIAQGNWNIVLQIAETVLKDAVLPMKLYVSSLAGQGLGLKVTFASQMNTSAENYEKSLQNLKNAATRRNESEANAALSSIEKTIADYRKAGKLEADDFGIGNIPKDSRLGSGFGNNNPSLYNRDFAEYEK